MRAVTDLPEPDSPTIATHLPGSRSNETPSTIWRTPELVSKATERFRTDTLGRSIGTGATP